MVMVQASFTNPDVIPNGVKAREPEKKEESAERRTRATGTMVIEPTDKCGFMDFVLDLESAGYQLVDAFYQQRVDPKDPRRQRTYHAVRFIFVRNECATPSEEFKQVRAKLRSELLEVILGMSLWRVRVFKNRFYVNNNEVAGQYAVSVNLEARTPLFNGDGTSVLAWRKDSEGRRVGDKPVPLESECELRITTCGDLELIQ